MMRESKLNMTKKQFKKGYPEGPVAFYPADMDDLEKFVPPEVFCCEEHMGDWLSLNKIGGVRGHRPWEFVKGVPVCMQCKKPLWEEKSANPKTRKQT